MVIPVHLWGAQRVMEPVKSVRVSDGRIDVPVAVWVELVRRFVIDGPGVVGALADFLGWVVHVP